MTNEYQAPFEGGKTPDPARTAKVKNIAKNLARKAMKKAATVKESVPERPYRRVYEPTSAQALNPGLRAKIDAASDAQKPRPLSGMRPIGKIKLMTREEVEQIDELEKSTLRSYVHKAMKDSNKSKNRAVKLLQSPSPNNMVAASDRLNKAVKRRFGVDKAISKIMTREEVELDEEFINGREYASHGLMHPKHAMQGIHQPSDRFVDFYASGTGDKMQGKVKSNDGKTVHIQAHPKMGDGKLHKFKVTTDLPKMTNEAKDEGEYDYEGDMAMSQLKSIITNAQKLHDMLEPNTNLPEWVQSKITLAEDYIVTAANYMNGEMNEEVEQVEEGLIGSLVKAYVSPKAQRLVGKGVKKVVSKLGASAQTQRRLQKVGMNWARSKIGEEAEQIEERKMGYEKLASAIRSRAAKKKLAVEATDPVGKEDADINNDGKTDKTDVYLHTKRRAIGKAIGTRLATKAGK
jgi:hypothetical protein